MKYIITHLKAPFPEGAKVGDVVDFPDVPAWALGKVIPAPDDVQEACIVANIEPVVSEPEPVASEPVIGAAPEPVSEHVTLSRDALEVEAKALGVSFNARTSDETLIQRIAAAKQ